ncbi:SusC/RagA family TonB-linked outer membrane protein [Pseudobacter ginsenosidimutans]|uniref:TonB-linked SusC/RagA family outer membrane protein n=1 Tax=Pseudobacter ginsenosidimutans TaxID=661488 RepID=A0A4Q7MG23_9BACT|nr:SusC/RagA family TonB-linked outer membrane protein [Pseudobacter ginsenosidimutans]QEC45588.1 SusC/RagA family TonB-linked outer membrane protein [Pseudobacter ginsenosidimutans]RZS67136.1 TonB-linked SusC/RagA family outer membrane protein [Pseudobacter ginsenosidimutans]
MQPTAYVAGKAFYARLQRTKPLLLMKCMIFFLLITISQATAKGWAQTVTYTAKNASIEQALEAVRKQTGYEFFFRASDLKDAKPVTIQSRNMPLEAFLNQLFKDQPVTWEIRNKNIVVTRRPTPTPDRSLTQAAIVVTGRITDTAGHPLQGATISIRGKNNSTTSDQQGLFSLEAATGETLIISYVGFETTTVTVRNEMQPLSILLKPARKLEDEVVVSTGYQRLPRERATGSFGVMNQAAIEKRSNLNILSYLEGQVPGLLTASDGRITIRGQSTMVNANRDPLIVVDGFPIERSVQTINANDVESISVLKDASAASIWGVRAANGVIVIQTKRGQSSRKPLDVNFTSTFSITPVPDFSELPFASSSSFMDFEKFRVDNNLTFFSGKPRPAISPVVDAYLNNPSSVAQLVESLKGNNAYDEFKDLFMHPATRQQYALALSGRGEKTSHRASFSYDKTGTEFKQNIANRFVADLFETVELHPSLRAELGLNYVRNNSSNNGMSYDDLRNLLPYQRIMGDDGSCIPQPNTFYQADKDALVATGYPYNWNYNLLQEFRNKANKTLTNNVTGIVALNYRIMDGIVAHAGYQYESGNTSITNLYNEETWFTRNTVNFSTSIRNNLPVSGIPKGSIYRENNNNFYSHTFRGQLKFDRRLGKSPNHYLTAIAGMEIRELGDKSSTQTKYGYDPQSLQFARVSYTTNYTDVLGATKLIPDETRFIDNRNRFVSFFSNAGYTFNDRYTLNASARLDKTNLFGSSKEYRNVWLWSAGAGWQLHKEHFFDVPVINSLVLRATYGINGNVDRSTSPFLIANVSTDQQTNRPYAYVANPANPLLRWEKTTVTNFGIDFSLLKSRIRGSIEYYNRQSEDLLGDATVNGTYGFNSAYINYASLNNRGVDIRLSGAVLNRELRWITTLNYSYNRNKVTKVDFPQKTVGSYLSVIAQKDKPLDYLYSYRWAGLSDAGVPRVYNEKGEIIDFKTDLADPAALMYEGSSVPPHYGAWINEFSYKRFSVTTNFTFKFGHYFRVPVIQYQSLFSGAVPVRKEWDARWQKQGDENLTNVPAAPTSITGLNVYDKYYQYADINVETASIIRFRELLINYTLPAKISARYPDANIVIGLQARNLASLNFNKADLDPEFQQFVPFSNSLSLPPRPELSLIIRANF